MDPQYEPSSLQSGQVNSRESLPENAEVLQQIGEGKSPLSSKFNLLILTSPFGHRRNFVVFKSRQTIPASILAM